MIVAFPQSESERRARIASLAQEGYRLVSNEVAGQTYKKGRATAHVYPYRGQAVTVAPGVVGYWVGESRRGVAWLCYEPAHFTAMVEAFEAFEARQRQQEHAASEKRRARRAERRNAQEEA